MSNRCKLRDIDTTAETSYSFFAHLVNILGAGDFTAPLCMLLLEKSANRITRQTAEEIQTSLSLPISVFQHNSHDLQVYVCYNVSEMRRIRTDQLNFSLQRRY